VSFCECFTLPITELSAGRVEIFRNFGLGVGLGRVSFLQGIGGSGQGSGGSGLKKWTHGQLCFALNNAIYKNTNNNHRVVKQSIRKHIDRA
jgi:hypothetical protein